MDQTEVYTDVQKYYGEEIKEAKDLKTQACVTGCGVLSKEVKKALTNVHDEIITKYYGCGSPFPEDLEGRTVLDLGCGTGRDCYVVAQLVGAKGKVIGVDMTTEQLEVARKYQDWHAEKFGFHNTEFKQGFIENLKDAGIEDNSVDVIISNCVVNLSPNKTEVFKEIFRVLKPGGELYFSDVYSDMRVSKEL